MKTLVDRGNDLSVQCADMQKSEDWSQNSTPKKATVPHVEAQFLRQVVVGDSSEVFAEASDAPDSRSEVFSQPILVSQKFTVVTPSEKWSAHQKADAITAASPSTENESSCTLEPVRVVGSYPTR